jgi:hypothetical protein
LQGIDTESTAFRDCRGRKLLCVITVTATPFAVSFGMWRICLAPKVACSLSFRWYEPLRPDERHEPETHDNVLFHVLFQYHSSFKIVVTFNTARLRRKTLLDSSLENVVNKPASGLVRFSYKLSVFQIVGFGFAAPRHPAFEARACSLWDGQLSAKSGRKGNTCAR